MITTTIGRSFLDAYNKEYGENKSPKEFFLDVFWELFYNHPKYMMTGGNSPFENPKISWKKGDFPDVEERKDRLKKTLDKIDSGMSDASVAIGYPAAESKNDKYQSKATSCCVSDICNEISPDEVYLSWIGAGLGVGVSGGYSILFNHPEIMLHLFEGWKVYRRLLNDEAVTSVPGLKINSWNGAWLKFRYNELSYSDDFDFQTLVANNVFAEKDGEYDIQLTSWSELFFNLSNRYHEQKTTGYLYKLGQTNDTLGFFRFNFSAARTLKSFYKRLFGEQAALNQAKDYQKLFGRHIKQACQQGGFGLRALEPKKLRDYFKENKTLKFSSTKVKPKKDESEEDFNLRRGKAEAKEYETLIYYQTYRTWLLAMITKNKEEELNYTQQVAEALEQYRERDSKTTRINLIKNELLGATSKKKFIAALASVVSETAKDIEKNDLEISELEVYKNLRDRVHMMNAEDFGYFVVLLRFDFTYVESTLNKK